MDNTMLIIGKQLNFFKDATGSLRNINTISDIIPNHVTYTGASFTNPAKNYVFLVSSGSDSIVNFARILMDRPAEETVLFNLQTGNPYKVTQVNGSNEVMVSFRDPDVDHISVFDKTQYNGANLERIDVHSKAAGEQIQDMAAFESINVYARAILPYSIEVVQNIDGDVLLRKRMFLNKVLLQRENKLP
jgi:hypothetical protein